MMIVGDVGEMFVPMAEGFLVTPSEAEVGALQLPKKGRGRRG